VPGTVPGRGEASGLANYSPRHLATVCLRRRVVWVQAVQPPRAQAGRADQFSSLLSTPISCAPHLASRLVWPDATTACTLAITIHHRSQHVSFMEQSTVLYIRWLTRHVRPRSKGRRARRRPWARAPPDPSSSLVKFTWNPPLGR
jgi:hypothetical protein